MKQKKCKYSKCGKLFDPYSSLQQVCSISHAIEYSKEKAWKVKKKELVLGLQTVNDLKKIAKVVFQKYVRLRDSGKRCISCDSICMSGDGSHYFSAGVYSGMIFDEDNCHLSCVQCNRFFHGNLIEYRKGLVKRYGEGFVIALEKRAEQNRSKKYTLFELRNIINFYKAKLK